MKYPSFIQNNTFYNLDHSKSNEEQMIALTENVKKIHSLTTKHYDSFETLINDYLKAGIEIFQMQTGIVSHITENKEYIIKDVVTNLDVIKKGDVFELEGTYCREVYDSHTTLGFPQVGKIKELQHHPVYVNLKLEAYISAPIFVNDKLYGTLNFTSLNPREHGFSENEHDLISMMGQSIGNFILLQEKEEHLKHLNFRMKELVGHVAHDLRNPLGAIKGLSEVAVVNKNNDARTNQVLEAIKEESTRSLELVNNLLDEAALGTGKVVMEKSYFDLEDMVNKTLLTFETLIKERHLKTVINIEKGLEVYADEKRIRQIFDNLLLNAFKYSKENSEIEINCIKVDDKIKCEVINEKSDTKTILDSSRYKSVGYGMDIIQEVLKQHDSKFIIENEEKFKASFELPIN